MYRDEHEAALRRAEALEREVEELKARSETNADAARRIAELEQRIGEARAGLAQDARRLAEMDAQLSALRSEISPSQVAPSAPPGPGATQPRAVVLAGVAVAVAIGTGAAVFLLRARSADVVVEPPLDDVAAVDDHARETHACAEAEAGLTGREERAKALVSCATELSDRGAALDALRVATGLYPSLPDAWKHIGDLSKEEGEGVAMCEAYAHYLSLLPEGDGSVAAAKGVREKVDEWNASARGGSCDLESGLAKFGQ